VGGESCFLNIVSTVSTPAPARCLHPPTFSIHTVNTLTEDHTFGPRWTRSCLPAAAFDIFDEWTGLSDACRPSLLSSVCIEFEAWGSGETEFLPAAFEVLPSSRRIRCTSSGVPPGARTLDLYSEGGHRGRTSTSCKVSYSGQQKFCRSETLDRRSSISFPFCAEVERTSVWSLHEGMRSMMQPSPVSFAQVEETRI
jgi:hypothetical protein